jgi:hypothetical protein
MTAADNTAKYDSVGRAVDVPKRGVFLSWKI